MALLAADGLARATLAATREVPFDTLASSPSALLLMDLSSSSVTPSFLR
jgi:hypothetical protein